LLEECLSGRFSQVLRNLLAILELMKLDSANYYLYTTRERHQRQIVQKERKHFSELQSIQRLTFANTLSWLRQHKTDAKSVTEHHRKCIIELVFAGQFGQETVPEVFRLDKVRLKCIHDALQNVALGGVIQTMVKKWAGKRLAEEDMDDLKARLTHCFTSNTRNLSIKDIIDVAKGTLGRVMPELPNLEIETTLNKVMSPSSPLFQTLFNRVYQVVTEAILENSCSTQTKGCLTEICQKHRMADHQDALEEPCMKLERLIKHNWSVFSGLYEEYWSKLTH
jgi:hypothetical protein